jgi:hypothetical protein
MIPATHYQLCRSLNARGILPRPFRATPLICSIDAKWQVVVAQVVRPDQVWSAMTAKDLPNRTARANAAVQRLAGHQWTVTHNQAGSVLTIIDGGAA